MKRQALISSVGLCVGLLPGCSDALGPDSASSPRAPPSVRSYVTGAALANLDAAGHFRLPAPLAPGPYPVVMKETAEEIALGVIRSWYANPNAQTIPGMGGLRESAEADHGGPISWGNLKIGPVGAYFAESHLEPLPPELGNPSIRYFGPHYLVPLFEGSTPAVVVSVAAYATNIILDMNGLIRRTDDLIRAASSESRESR